MFLAEAIPYDQITEAGAVGLALFMLILAGIFGRSVIRMMEIHVQHLNDCSEKHTELLTKISASTERHSDLLRDIAGTLTTTAAAASAAAASAAAAAAAAATNAHLKE